MNKVSAADVQAVGGGCLFQGTPPDLLLVHGNFAGILEVQSSAFPGHMLDLLRAKPKVKRMVLLELRKPALEEWSRHCGRLAMQNPVTRQRCIEAGHLGVMFGRLSRNADPDVMRAWWTDERRQTHSELKRRHRAQPVTDIRQRIGFRKSVKGRDGSGLTVGERKVHDQLVSEGWEVYRGGWPDFFARHPDGRRMCVEVKSPTDSVRRPQVAMQDVLLEEFGLETKVVRVTNVVDDKEAA